MPVVATPVVSSALTSEKVREFMRDYSNMNPLLDDVEFSDKEINSAIDRAVDHANVIGRPTGYTKERFPNTYVLLLGTCSFLLKSEAFRQLRNQATYQDGNIQPVGIDDKQQLYSSLSQALSSEFNQLMMSIKISANMRASGRLASPLYRSVTYK